MAGGRARAVVCEGTGMMWREDETAAAARSRARANSCWLWLALSSGVVACAWNGGGVAAAWWVGGVGEVTEGVVGGGSGTVRTGVGTGWRDRRRPRDRSVVVVQVQSLRFDTPAMGGAVGRRPPGGGERGGPAAGVAPVEEMPPSASNARTGCCHTFLLPSTSPPPETASAGAPGTHGGGGRIRRGHAGWRRASPCKESKVVEMAAGKRSRVESCQWRHGNNGVGGWTAGRQLALAAGLSGGAGGGGGGVCKSRDLVVVVVAAAAADEVMVEAAGSVLALILLLVLFTVAARAQQEYEVTSSSSSLPSAIGRRLGRGPSFCSSPLLYASAVFISNLLNVTATAVDSVAPVAADPLVLTSVVGDLIPTRWLACPRGEVREGERDREEEGRSGH
uniref:Uncharacterized protein n=1 Tax=Oryza sativa subsp. japonica TaxID=39947 RepID=Q60ER6_ORYSJ|nr:hypothetical protein [Oryza sativa Japonica Group]